jgi:uncharacterized protein (TIGR03435 family)
MQISDCRLSLINGLRIGAVVAAIMPLHAQAPASDSRPTFEVVSIKQDSAPFTGGSAGWRPGGTFVANIPAGSLVNMAFGGANLFQQSQIFGLPDWGTVMRFNITAKVPAGVDATSLSAAQRAAYVRSMLEDRFALKAHVETREVAVYELVAEPAAAGRLKPIDCSDRQNAPKCGISFQPGHVSGAETTKDLAGTLSGPAGRPVIDRTNLAGRFVVDLQWNAGVSADDERPSIFVAVQEQLGLKLQASRAQMDVLVVDRLDKPTED